MPPKRKAPAVKKPVTLSGLVGSASSEEDKVAAPPPAKTRKRAPGKKMAVEVESAKKPAATRKKAAAKKQPVKEEDEEDEEDEGEAEDMEATTAPAKKPTATRKKAVAKEVPEPKEEEEEEEEEEVAAPPVKARKKAAPKSRKKAVEEVAETQQFDDDEIAPTPTQVHSKKRRAIDEEEDDDGGFALKKARGAETALQEYKKNTEVRMKAADKLIAGLQGDLKRQTALAAESRALKKNVEAKDVEIAKLQAKLAELNKMVSTAQKETQVLQAKLSATQSQIQVPGSAVKSNTIGRGILPGAKGGIMAGSGDQAWVSHVKEELYGDLTNLVIMSIKKETEYRVFECLQTGTNGALHFKLSVREPCLNNSRKQKAPAAPSDNSEEDPEYIFIPMLDKARDKFVISLLPDYLRNEIMFSRDHAARFYQKINTILMKPPPEPTDGDKTEEDEDEEEEEESEGEDGETTIADGDETIADTTMGEGSDDEEAVAV